MMKYRNEIRNLDGLKTYTYQLRSDIFQGEVMILRSFKTLSIFHPLTLMGKFFNTGVEKAAEKISDPLRN